VRDEKRGPGLRGNILVEEGDPATTSNPDAPADAAASPPPAAEPGPQPATFRGTIRPDAGTHDTGPNPIVTDAHVEASPTGPNPVIHPTGPNPVVPAEAAAPAEPAEPEAGRAEAEAEAEAPVEAEAEPAPEAETEPDAEAKAEPEAEASPEPEATPEASGVVEPAHISAPVPARPRAPELYRVPDPGPEPSWGKVLATTISLWASRRFGRGQNRNRGQIATRSGAGYGTGAPAGTVAVYGGAEAPTPSSRWGGVRWPLVVFVLLLVILALVGLQLSGALNTSSPGQSTAGSGGNAGQPGPGGGSLAGATAARNHAASWIARQVTSSDLIACDPLMCSTLQDDGVPASRLMTMDPTSTDPLGADVVAATSSVRSQFGSRLVSEYAPELIATFGSGASRVDVRAVANFGAAAFQAKEQADLAARKSAGVQLLKNSFHVPAQGARQIRAGQVDSRVLVTLAALLSQRPVQIGSFGDTGPGAPVLYRQVTVVNAPGQTGTSALSADLKQVQTQRNSFRPAHARIVHLAHGQSALRIEFGAPDQPGLLSGGNS
jgi:hypothetical protein